MGMLGDNKRKGKLPQQKNSINSNIIKLDIESMIIKSPRSTCYFKRLKYKNCPNLFRSPITRGVFKKGQILIDMNRDSFIRDVFYANSQFKGEMAANMFRSITKYVRCLDEADIEVNFRIENVLYYHRYLYSKVKRGEIKPSSMSVLLGGLKNILVELGQQDIARKIPLTEEVKTSTVPFKAYCDTELVAIAKKLFHAFSVLANHLMSGTKPHAHPFFDENELKNLEYTEQEIKKIKRSAELAVEGGHWENHLIRCAIMITFMFTGLNPSPLYEMKRKDVKFKTGTADSYTFESVKGRAKYQKQSNDIGFTKRGVEFIEKWLIISKKLSQRNDNNFLFPYIKRNGSHTSLTSTSNPQFRLNKALKPYKLASLSASRFRKTRSNILMRVMGSAVEVAAANNNSLSVTQKNYLHGIEEDNIRQLAGAFQVQGAMARGENKKAAINTATFYFKDPITEFDYKKLKRNNVPNITPSGIRCGNPDGNKAKASIKKLKKAGLKINKTIKACTDFLDCFGCKNHIVIAEEYDIWLMLSFKDTIKENLSKPSINSLPSEKYYKVLNTVNAILKRFQDVAPQKYTNAMEKNNVKPHPLYSDIDSIEDLQGVYA